MTKKIYLVDWNSFIYRMFFALPEFSTKDWKIVNAIFWMAKFFVWQLTKENPDYLVFIVDAKWKNFRHKIFEEYKATRDKMPDNLKDQIGDILAMIKNMWIKIVEISWYEADDVIWTLTEKLWKTPPPSGTPLEKGRKYMYEIDILTWDKDLYSLVSENVKIYDTMKAKKFGLEETKEKFWVEANMIIDYLAIVWDKADNIPWIEGFWPKKAVDLINIIWKVEKIYDFIEKNSFEENSEKEKKEKLIEDFWEENAKKINSIFKWKTFEKLINSKENAYLSKKLATLEKNVELENFNLEDYKFEKENLKNEKVLEIFEKFEFSSLIPEKIKNLKKWENLWLKVQIVDDDEKLEKLLEKITPPLSGTPLEKGRKEEYEKIFLDTETTSLNIKEAKLVWISIFLDEENIFYINRMHKWKKINDEKLLDFLEKLFKMDKLIIWHNIKYDLEILELFKININNSSYSSENKKEEKQISLNF